MELNKWMKIWEHAILCSLFASCAYDVNNNIIKIPAFSRCLTSRFDKVYVLKIPP